VSDEFDAPEWLSPRARRAMPLIAGALATIVVVGIVYLHPSFPTSHSVVRAAPSPSPPPLVSQQYQVAYDFLTSTAGWALVADQASASPKFWVFKTTDKAKHWQIQLAGAITSHNGGPLKVQFFDRNEGMVMLGGDGAIYRTRDGGVQWTALPVPAFSFASVYFSDPSHGWILGTIASADQSTFTSQFFSTSDAGDNWVALPQPPAFPFLGKGGFNAIAFRGPSEGWLGGFAAQPTVNSTLDGGATWHSVPLPVTVVAKGGFADGSAPLLETTVTLLPGAGVLAVVFDTNATPVGLTSFDGGSTWRRISPPPGETAYSDFVFQDTFHWWAMRNGTLFRSSNAGQSWMQVSQQLDEWDYAPQFIDAKHAWGVMTASVPTANLSGGTGLATTSDGGVHWNPVNVPKPS
jgi:photosystem II stability/assembly factor-like uncharacterized protein